MSDPLGTLAELADAVERGAGDGSLDSERAVQLRAVEPLLEILGWDVRGPEVVPETELSGQTVEYLLRIEAQPAVAVRTVPPGTDPTTGALDRLESGLASGAVSRAMVADGRTIVLVLADGDDVHRRSILFQALPEHADALGQFHRSVLEETVTPARTDRREAARRLAANRDAVVDAVTAEIVSVTGSEFEDVVAEESTRTIDALLEQLDPGDVEHDEPAEQEPSEQPEQDANDASQAAGRTDAANEGRTPARGAGDGVPDTNGGESARASRERSEGTVAAESTDEPDESARGGEYVVRFFGGASSVGAVGTQSPDGTVVGVVRYLLENHDLEASLTLPWQTASGTTILARSGEPPDWTTLENAGEDGGRDGDGNRDSVAVRSIDDPPLAKETIEELADATGLRVMYQGDW